MAALANISTNKFCAFCKYWWDPTCRYIMPNIGAQWYFDGTARCRCIKKGVDVPASGTCGLFKCKVDW